MRKGTGNKMTSSRRWQSATDRSHPRGITGLEHTPFHVALNQTQQCMEVLLVGGFLFFFFFFFFLSLISVVFFPFLLFPSLSVFSPLFPLNIFQSGGLFCFLFFFGTTKKDNVKEEEDDEGKKSRGKLC